MTTREEVELVAESLEHAQSDHCRARCKMNQDFKAQAESLIDTVSDLQRQVLLKHTTSVLEAFHAEITKRDEELATLRQDFAAKLEASGLMCCDRCRAWRGK